MIYNNKVLLRESSHVTPHFRALFLKNDYVETTDDFETRFLRIFLFILELWTQFLVIYLNYPCDFHMSLNTPLSKKSRAHWMNDCDLSDKLKRKNRIKYCLLSSWLWSDTSFSRDQKHSQNGRCLKKKNSFTLFFVLIIAVKIYWIKIFNMLVSIYSDIFLEDKNGKFDLIASKIF